MFLLHNSNSKAKIFMLDESLCLNSWLDKFCPVNLEGFILKSL